MTRAGSICAVLAAATAGCFVPDHRFDETGDAPPERVRAILDWTGELAGTQFFDAPFPLELRTSGGRLDWSGFGAVPAAHGLERAFQRTQMLTGTSLTPVMFVRFTGPLSPLRPDMHPAGMSEIYLVDIDPQSPAHRTRYPVVAQTLAEATFVPSNLLAFQPAPGVVLRPNTYYGVFVEDTLRDATGRTVASDPDLAAWRSGAPAVPTIAQQLAPLWDVIGPEVTLAGPAAALVFRTGDPLAATRARSAAAVALATVTIDPASLVLVTDPTQQSPDLCELRGAVQLPQFQEGVPPFTSGGELPSPVAVQRSELVAFSIAVPKTPMPATGYPLVLTASDFGDYANAALAPVTVDAITPDAQGRRFGTGIAFPLAKAGLASASAAPPQSVERAPANVLSRELRADNLPVVGWNHEQAAIELRLLRAAIASLAVPATTLSGCLDPALLGGATAVTFDASRIGIHGHGHGAASALLAAVTDPAFVAVATTGARGGWTSLATSAGADGARDELAATLGVAPAELSPLHPLLAILGASLDGVDPTAIAATIAARDATGFPARAAFDAVVAEDADIPIADAAALARAFEAPIAGTPSAPALLALVDQGALRAAAYPVTSATPGGALAPAAIVQAPAPSSPSPAHDAVFHQRGLRYQLACFYKTTLSAGAAKIVAPVDRDDAFPCD